MIQFKSVYLITALVVLFLCAMSCGGIRQGCIKGNCTYGQGTYMYVDGAKYVGEFWNGTLNGQGTYTYADGRKYVGEWKNGEYNGQGTLTYPDGKKYVGEFWGGKRYGQGTLTLPDGTVQRGIWKNNELKELVQQPVSVHGTKNEDSLVKTDEESIYRGKDLYEKMCKKCHDAYSSENITGPGMQGILKKDMLPSSQKPATALNILNQLNNPFDKMPSFSFLSEEEKLSIIAFLKTL